ncbi:MAG TPA: outer membrane protein assembly factor BamA [Candidatus Acidoferrales bacterium]|nr:outer membrane protein assembly factor BamA [Candidatus Acidoferrales bacterium]
MSISLAARNYSCFVSALRASMLFLLAAVSVCLAPSASPHSLVEQSAPQAPAAAAAEGTPTIERIEFQGNRRIRSETLRARIFSRPGDPVNDEALRRDFHALWNTQYFEDIRLEVEDSADKPNQKIIIFYVTERPIVRRIEYKGNKSVSESDILDRFKDRKVGLSIESQFDPTKIKKAEVVIKELLAEHGRQFATVKPTFERLPGTNAVKLTFNIDEGPKVKVGKIIITGNTAFSSGKIIRTMRNSKPYGVPLGPVWPYFIPVLSKTFDRPKLDEDMEIGIRGIYQDNGYFKVLVKDPIIQNVTVSEGYLPKGVPLVGIHQGRATNITIPIEEGARYRMGTLHVRNANPDEGLFFKTAYLESIFPIKKGEIFSVAKVRKAIEDYTKLYGNFGFIDFTAVPDTEVDDATKTINLTFAFDQQKQFFVRRIDFTGNTGTRDKVIRRELLLNEGDMFRNNLWELSLLRLNQLDYFEAVKPENAEIKRNVKQGTVDILLKLKEKGKQSISLTGGVSGFAGTYIGLTYQTNNFLGLGETLTLSGNVGTLQTNVSFGFTEPYLFDRPISTGFTVFASRYNFNQAQQYSLAVGYQVQLNPNTVQNYIQNSDGFTLFASYPLKKLGFTRLGLTYGYTDTSITGLSTASTALFNVLQFQQLEGPSSLSGIHESKITPTLSYNTVNNPVNPTSGKSLFLSSSFEGSILGGNVNTVSEIVEAKYFRPNYHKRNVIAMRFLGAFETGYGGKVIPPFSRFYLGGEQDLRGFDIRTVSPIVFVPTLTSTSVSYLNPRVLDGAGNPTSGVVNIPTLSFQTSFPGGDTELVTNFEYRIPLFPHVTMSIFGDAGATGALRQSQLQLNSTDLSTLTQQFPGTTISRTLQFQPGTNFMPRTSAGLELVVQLPIVQAPFRIYWAYNFNRMAEVITAPATQFPGPISELTTPCPSASTPGGQPPPCPWQIYKAQVPLADIWNSQVAPQILNLFNNPQKTNFFDPVRTFRFTVSRTF